MPNYYSGNYYLSLAQMQANAKYLYSLLLSKGWTLNAIAGLLGNTQTESTHNPGIWQNLNAGSGPGYGLTQWTPYTKYTDWCTANHLTASTMEAAVARLQFEIDNPNEQWVTHTGYPLTFPEFMKSTETASYLAMTFLHNYEMPGDLNQPNRGTQATYWYQYLSGEDPTPPGPGPGPSPDRNQYTYGRGILVSIIGINKNRRR